MKLNLNTKHVKIVSILICQVHDINSNSRGKSISLNTGATHFYVQLRLPDKGCAIKELVVCLILEQKRS